jgi:O-antigen/teichoic acid export membrane protein
VSASLARLTGGRVLARNSLLNLAGLVLPMLAALLAIPLLIDGLGKERFGILTVAWVVVGYFGLFDLGLGRALTKLVAERLGTGAREELPSLVWTSLFLLFALGILGALALAGIAPWLVRSVLEIPPTLEPEALSSFYLLAASLPWVISTTGFLGVLEANQSFGFVNALRVPMGLLNYLGPLAVIPFSTSLPHVVMLLIAVRLVAWVGHLLACLRVLPALRRGIALEWTRLRMLARVGGWMTVSNTVSPMMTHLDRFLVGALISMSAVTYYVTPYELVTKFTLFPTSLMAVLFPAFAASFLHDRLRSRLLFDRSLRAIFMIIFPAMLIVFTLAREGMTLWLGEDFANHSAAILRWLALGVFINCIAQVPFSFIQGIGRPDITGKLHMLELPLYAVAIWGLSRLFGLEGVAMAWVFRVSLDAAILFIAAARFLPTGGDLLRNASQMVALTVLVFGLAALQSGLGMKIAFLIAALLLFALIAWWRILAPSERAFVQRRYVADS